MRVSIEGDPALLGLYCYCRNSAAFWDGFSEAAAADSGPREIKTARKRKR